MASGTTFYNSNYKQNQRSVIPEPEEDWDDEINNDTAPVSNNVNFYDQISQPPSQKYQGGGSFSSQTRENRNDQTYSNYSGDRDKNWRSSNNQRDGWGGGRETGGQRGGFSSRHSDMSGDTMASADNSGVEVPSSCVGRIIGKGGSKINELRDESGAGIHVPKERKSGGTVRVELSGSEDAKARARQLIEDLVNNTGRRDGFRGGDSYGRSSEPSQSRFNSEPSQSGFGREPSRSGFNSEPSQSGFGREPVRSGFNSEPSQSGFGREPSRSGFSSEPSQSGFGREPRQRFGDTSSDSGVTEVEVSCGVVPRIIGKGGSMIRDLQDQTGAKINILRERSDGVTSFVEIKGSEKARADAKELIDDLADAANNRPERSNFSSSSNDMSQAEPQVKIDWSRLKEESERAYKAKWSALPPIKKNFYFEDPHVANLPPQEVARIRNENNNIQVQNLHPQGEGHIPNPVTTFDEAFGHFPEILELLHLAGFKEPSPIQKQGWPVALSGVDLIGIAQTGTGKTLAFLLPAFIHIENQVVPRVERLGPTVLVLSPTRELALQIESEVNKYSYKGIKCCCVYGGGSRKNQINTITKGVEIIVATPGRLNDLISNDIINLMSVTYLVLDEADRMLDMGFEPEIRKVLLDIRPDRHTLMTSATWPEGVRRLANSYMTNPMQVFVGSLDLAAVHSVHQRVEIIDDDLKRERLVEFLTHELEADEKVIVFVGRKITADDISSDLAMSGVTCQCIHGDREQSDREQAIQEMKDGTVKILIATDVASRGLDICDITYVFNYDFPRNIEEYVHRVGRTGRAGKTGTSLTLVTRGDWRNARDLIKILEEADQEVPDELYSMAERFERKMKERQEERRNGGGGGFRGRGMASFATIGGDRRRGRGRGGHMDSASLFMSCI